jgi:hypothetical protein
VNDKRLKKLITIHRLKAVYTKPIKQILRTLWPAIQAVRCLRGRLWIINGDELSSGEKLTIAFMGSGRSRDYWAKLVFNGVCEEKNIGNRWLFDVSRSARTNADSVSLMIVEIPSIFAKWYQQQGKFYIPRWLHGEMDTYKVASILSKLKQHQSIAEDIRKIKKNKLRFEVTNQPQKFYEFYHDMYVPFITKRHGRTAVIEEYEALCNLFRNGDLMFITQEDEQIAGILITYTTEKAWMWIMGTKNGDLEYIQTGAGLAMYYYALKYLCDKGYQKVGMGLSRALLRDGALQYKKKWGLEITGTDSISYLIKPVMENEAVKSFLINNPFILRNKTGLSGTVFISADKTIDDKDIDTLFRDYYFQGITNITLYRLCTAGEIAPITIPESLSEKICIIPM